MVPGVVENALQSVGLEPNDIPKVVGAVVATKYATLAAGVAIGLRYQPLRRVVLARASVLPGIPWAQQQRVRVFEALKNAKGQRYSHLRRSWSQQHAAFIREALDTAKWNTHKNVSQQASVAQIAKDSFSEARSRIGKAKKKVTAAVKAGKSMLLHKQLQVAQRRQRSLVLLAVRQTWHGWLSQKYWHLADALEAAAHRNRIFSSVSRTLGFMPKTLAVGTAEGLLLAKLAFPITAPLTLVMVVLALK
jgi:hypothetical protein